MKLRSSGILFLLGMFVIAVGIVIAQGGGGDNEENGTAAQLPLYADIPQSRAEDGAYTLGYSEAPVTVIEFADYLCGHCQDYHEVITRFIEEYVVTGRAKFQYRFMNIIDANYSPLMAAITECAGEQGRFWSAHDLLYTMASNREIDPNLIVTVSERLNLDTAAMQACTGEIGTRPFQDEADDEWGQELGVTGTPAIRVQVGDGPSGAISIDGIVYEQGGAPFGVLQQFVESENPAELFVLINQLRNDHYLHDESVVTNEPCSTPCWRGITVGETSWNEALAIIETDEQLTEPQIRQAQVGPAKQAIWGQIGGDLCCQMVTMDGETIAFLWLQLAPTLTLEDVIAAHGEPTFLTGGPYTPDQAYVTLYYPSLPMAVSVFVAGTETGMISETSEIIGIEYMNAEGMQQVLEQAPLHTWEGYQSYRDYMESAIEATPESES